MMTVHTPSWKHHVCQLWLYAALMYVAMLVNAARYLTEIDAAGPLVWLFSLAALLTYFAVYLLPAFVLVGLLDRLLYWPRLEGLFGPSAASVWSGLWIDRPGLFGSPDLHLCRRVYLPSLGLSPQFLRVGSPD